MLSLKGASKRFGATVALQATDLRLPRSQTTALIGPSGCGKSTLLRLLNGLLFPDTGEVWFDGKRLTGSNVHELRRRMGYVIQDGGLFPHLTASENITLMARFLGWDSRRIDRRLEELAQLTRLRPGLLERFPVELSGGQAQRISLMRALMLEPGVLLLDEPMAALDPMIRSDLQEDLRAIFRRLETTVVLVTHDLAEAVYLANQIVLLRAGKVEQMATGNELMSSPANDFVREFVRAQRYLQSTEDCA